LIVALRFWRGVRRLRRRLALLAMVVTGTAAQAAATDQGGLLHPCRLRGLETAALCGSVQRPLDPAAPAGSRIEVHFAVLPALARNKRPDPVFFYAGGPGQSAIALAGQVGRLLGRLSNQRDIVLIDQRGTGRSAPLVCDDPSPTRPLREALDPLFEQDALRRCRLALQRLPHGDLRHFTTVLATQDADAVRRALGAERINLVGVSYGTRVALDHLRQFPQTVRRVVVDGVAPADMVLPASFAVDGQAALDALLAWCAADESCHRLHPGLARTWADLLAGLPRDVVVSHPMTGGEEALRMTSEMLVGLVRAPLYAPALASALPAAIEAAAAGRWTPLVALAMSLSGHGEGSRLAQGMHFSVVCSEDLPRMDATDPMAGPRGALDLYRKACADWPRGAVPPAFYRVPVSPVPVLLLSGGLDPVTPPRHAERVARALGDKARQAVVPNAGHGVMGLGCVRDLVHRFVDLDAEGQALALDTGCAEGVPRPPVFRPVQAEAAAEAGR
jgi:pimeloyl-ACP methyl ester carboxylesterase